MPTFIGDYWLWTKSFTEASLPYKPEPFISILHALLILNHLTYLFLFITVNNRSIAQTCFFFFFCFMFLTCKVTHLTAVLGWRLLLMQLTMPRLHVVMSEEMMPLFQPVVLLRVFPAEVFLKAKDLQSAWYGNVLWTKNSVKKWHRTQLSNLEWIPFSLTQVLTSHPIFLFMNWPVWVLTWTWHLVMAAPLRAAAAVYWTFLTDHYALCCSQY